MNAKLIGTDSYFNIFPILTDLLCGKANDLTRKNFVFCEEKLSLMAERAICAKFGGTFNTEVYSFGNFLRTRKTVSGLLSKEGSAMVVKRILSEIPLVCFNKGKTNLAPSLFELISQLKSAKVFADDLSNAASMTDGILSAKLKDISAVYSAYETYLAENGLSDQGSALALLPEIVENDDDIAGADVYIVGFSGFTVQMRRVISAIMKKAGSCTAILTGGENEFAFVNETARVFKEICADLKLSVAEKFVKSDYSAGGATIKDGLFNPFYKLGDNGRGNETGDEKKPEAFFLAAKSVSAETERIAEVIKRKVMDGNSRYRDFTVIVPPSAEYKEAVRKSFNRLSVPYFIDAKIKPENFPAVSLVYAYCDLFIRGLKIPTLAAFFKNPYVSSDKDLADEFENYLYKYDVCYDKIRKPFSYPADGGKYDLDRLEEFRAYIAGLIGKFDAEKLIGKLNFDEKTEDLCQKLVSLNENQDAEINRQAAAKVKEVIAEMKILLPSTNEPSEFKVVFSGGVSAMEISVIPQYNDAVFVGNFKQAAIAQSRYLFAAGLTGEIPSFTEDVALLTDGDIDALERVKVLLEPKINVVNHRLREEVALGLSAYRSGLYLSYPLSDFSGGQTIKSEILTFAERNFVLRDFPPYDGYITKAEGTRSFSRDCNRFASLKIDDFSTQSGFYTATDGEPERIVNYANKEIKVRLDGKRGALLRGVTSPTAIEDYYACPYRSFLIHTLKVKEREKGKVNALSVGNLMHEIFNGFIGRVEYATDKAKSDALFNEIAAEVLKKDEYSRFDDAESSFGVRLALNECKKYCYEMSRFYSVTAFRTDKTRLERTFGYYDKDGNAYPAVDLMGGKVKLAGKIDRVDEYQNYFRITDYKTGGSEVGDDKIFAGVKLQLYLYSLAVTDKTLAGAYYLRVNDEYKAADGKVKPLFEGKTALDTDALTDTEGEFIPTDGKNKAVTVDTLAGVQKYVKALAEQAAEQLDEGVIVPSPYAGTCAYCDFASACRRRLAERKVSGVDTEFIENSAKTAGNSKAERGGE